ncbi:MAG: GNAT family N-acetyltransferase [Rhizobiales bacterium]|nr:GNAT family N-acetyltransferase [Hyphomicrobiales bacterium]
MAATPLLEVSSGGAAAPMIARLAGLAPDPLSAMEHELLEGRKPPRKLAIYSASAGFDMVEELDYLCSRTVEPNVFFNPRFLAPAMPRLEDREVRLAVIRDGDEFKSRLRLLVPFSIEKPGTPLGQSIVRAWASPFGPLGTPLLDRDEPEQVIESFFSMMSRPSLKFPKIFVLPDMRLDGAFASVMTSMAEARGLPLVVTNRFERPFLESTLDGDAYLKNALKAHHYREFRRLKRRLGERGRLEYRIDRSADDVRRGLESFLALEASGWKGRQRTAMAIDRYRAAFAREAINGMAENDLCRVHALLLDGRVIASLVVFVEAGIAYTWKTAYDETLSEFSPGTLLMIEATKHHLDDPNIMMTDSCAVPDHPVMSRLWTERRPIGTLVVGMTPNSDRAVHQAASQLHLYRETRNLARILRSRLRSLLPGR